MPLFASADPRPLPYATAPAHLPALLQRLVQDLADPAVAYQVGGHYYVTAAGPSSRHFPAGFTLRHGTAWDVEVGADFVAFTTDPGRRPERGALRPWGAWTARFRAGGAFGPLRATVPFAQLYQLCRKVLTPDEQALPEVNYGSNTVVYYNAPVHRQYLAFAAGGPLPAAAPRADEHPLVALLTAVAASLAVPFTGYVVHTVPGKGPAGPGTLYLHAHTTRDLALEANAFTCAVRLDPHDRRAWTVVRIAYAHVHKCGAPAPGRTETPGKRPATCSTRLHRRASSKRALGKWPYFGPGSKTGL